MCRLGGGFRHRYHNVGTLENYNDRYCSRFDYEGTLPYIPLLLSFLYLHRVRYLMAQNMDFTPENPNWRRNRKTSDRLHHSTGYLFPGAASMRPEVAVRPKGTSQGTS